VSGLFFDKLNQDDIMILIQQEKGTAMFNEYNGSQWMVRGGIVYRIFLGTDPKSEAKMIQMMWSQDSFVDTKEALQYIKASLLEGKMPPQLVDNYQYDSSMPWLEVVSKVIETSSKHDDNKNNIARRMFTYILNKIETVNSHMLIDVNWSPSPLGEKIGKGELAPLTLADQMLGYLVGVLLPVGGMLYRGHMRAACMSLELFYPESFKIHQQEILAMSNDVEIRGYHERKLRNLSVVIDSIIKFLMVYHPDPPLIGSLADKDDEEAVI